MILKYSMSNTFSRGTKIFAGRSPPVVTGLPLTPLALSWSSKPPPKWIMKHYKSVEFLSNFRRSGHLNKRKAPLLKTFRQWFCPSYAYGYKKRIKNKGQYLLDVQPSFKKARNNARQPDTAELRWKAVLSVLDATFGCCQLHFPQTVIACWNSIC